RPRRRGRGAVQGHERVERGRDDGVRPSHPRYHGVGHHGGGRFGRLIPVLDGDLDVVGALLHRRPREGVGGSEVAHDPKGAGPVRGLLGGKASPAAFATTHSRGVPGGFYSQETTSTPNSSAQLNGSCLTFDKNQLVPSSMPAAKS